jgi:uncharacterized protein YegL
MTVKERNFKKLGVINSNKTVNVSEIECGGSFKVKLSLSAGPKLTNCPADIVLLLNRSESMGFNGGTPLTNLKAGVNRLIDIILGSANAAPDGKPGGVSRMAIVSFADTATVDAPLTNSVNELKGAVDRLSAGGQANHTDGLNKALDVFDRKSCNRKILLLVSDGITASADDPEEAAKSVKANDVTLYSIGLQGEYGLNKDTLLMCASEPDAAYTMLADENGGLSEILDTLSKNISHNGATNIKITDTVNSCFRITSISSPTKGTATLINPSTVCWTIPALGAEQNRGACLEFTVEHIGSCSGTVKVNERIIYEDREHNKICFPSPEIDVDCGIAVNPEDSPTPVDITSVGCQDTIHYDAGELYLQRLGRIVQVDVTIKNVCPGKRIALAALLFEVDEEGNEYKRGLKTYTIPAHDRSSCRDVVVRCINFVLPEDISESTGTVCGTRNLRVKFITHYIDNDYEFCNEAEAL